MMNFKIINAAGDAYEQLLELRNQVLRAPLGLSIYEEDLSRDKKDVIIAVYEDAELIGCVMLQPAEAGSMKLRQMAVREDRQGKNIGSSIVRYAEQIALAHGFNTITMHARITAVPFYRKLGYSVYGEEFDEVTIPHVAMQKTIG